MKNNYIFLGVAISYFIIAIIQYKINGTLPASIYITVAFLSVELTMFELLKTCINRTIENMKQWENTLQYYDSFGKKILEICGKHKNLMSEAKIYEKLIITEERGKEIDKNTKKINALNKYLNIATNIQIVLATVIIIVTPLKAIPYDELTKKTLNITTLITFGMMFLSYFLSETFTELHDTKFDIERKVSSYYLNILQRMDDDNEKEKVSD